MKNQPNAFIRALLTLLSLFITVVAIGSFIFLYLDTQLPNVSELKTLQLQTPIRIYTVDNKLISEFGELHRTPVTFEQIPKPLINAVLATEDQRYYEHMGVDPYGLLRATGQLIMTGTKSQGGSTITMQVARNFYLTRKKTYLRKLHEIMLAMKIERQISKDKILELYLNKIYFGSRAYGVAAAAQAYFGKDLSQLTLAQMALIAGLPKAPSALNPFVNLNAAKDRRDHVLHRMLERGYITLPVYKQAIAEPLKVAPRALTFGIDAPYVADMVRDSLLSQLGDAAYKGGYCVYTTIDSRLQETANSALQTSLIAYDRRHGYRAAQRNLGAYQPGVLDEWLSALSDLPPIHGCRSAIVVKLSHNLMTALLDNGKIIPVALTWNGTSVKTDLFKSGDLIRVEQSKAGWALSQIPDVEGAMVSLNPKNGAIKALVGGFSYAQSNFNRAVQAERQPGSSFKPFIYAAALDKGYTLSSLVEDAPLTMSDPSVGIWRPQNDDHIFRGPMRLRVALIHSVNLVTIRLLQNIGLTYTVNYLTRFGFEKKQLPHSLSLALGTASVTPLQMAGGYAVFANGGYRVTPYLIDKIKDGQGKVVYQAKPNVVMPESSLATVSDNSKPLDNSIKMETAPSVISPQIAYLMTSVLQDVIKLGTGRAALVLNRSDIAGKTGTTNEEVDGWFCGYTSQLVTTAWVGFDQPRSLHEHGSRAALPMWIDFMRVALAAQPVENWTQPEGIISERIDPKTGLLAGSFQLNAVTEWFRKFNVPTKEAPADTKGDETDAMDEAPKADNEPGDLKIPPNNIQTKIKDEPVVKTPDQLMKKPEIAAVSPNVPASVAKNNSQPVKKTEPKAVDGIEELSTGLKDQAEKSTNSGTVAVEDVSQ